MAMIIEMDTHMRHTTEFAETLTKEQRNYAKEQMARQLADLLARSPRENLYWQESVTDLIDLAHEVYTWAGVWLTARGAPSASAA